MQTPSTVGFNSFANNVNSQFGEDGIIKEILERINRTRDPEDRYCVEFGAWDGKFLSNTYRLIAECGYHAVLIEADEARFRLLCENIPQDSVTKIREFVSFEGEKTLDGILSKTNIPTNFDLLSIDIDGNDYHILDSLTKYKPILICIEFNPSIPNAVEYVQPRDFAVKRGASAKAIKSLASRMGYALVASTYCNLFLLDRAYLPAVGLEHEPSLDELRDDSAITTYVFCGFDGTVLLSKPLQLQWHGMKLTESDVQVLPSFLRRFADDYSFPQRICFFVLRALRDPKATYWKFRRWMAF